MGSCSSPLGGLLLAWTDNRLVSLDYEDFQERYDRLLHRRFPQCIAGNAAIPRSIRSVLDAYFAGATEGVDELEVELGGSAFENRVWQSLRAIKPGTTATYGTLASNLGVSNGARAVGRANSMNPIAIVVPCHRVIGANSSLTGYAGGLERKRWLLEHERRFTSSNRDFLDQQLLF
jgi:methylated-DNA-[protein]-cysteine S-methyltransferase